MADASRNLIAWQGWSVTVPAKWNPVKLEGDADEGYALFADMQRPRLGLRWKRLATKRLDVGAWAKRAIREEVGKLAAEEARPMETARFEGSLLYVDPEPPGRDVWSGFSRASGRAVQLIYHSRGRDHALATTVLPNLFDTHDQGKWSVFDLSCEVPEGFKLAKHTLYPGDLGLAFVAGRKRMLTVRQVALAKIALGRMPLDKWLRDQERRMEKHYAPRGEPRDVEFVLDARSVSGLTRDLPKRVRFLWMLKYPRRLTTYALHDELRDRLVLIQATDQELAAQALRTVGWARGATELNTGPADEPEGVDAEAGRQSR